MFIRRASQFIPKHGINYMHVHEGSQNTLRILHFHCFIKLIVENHSNTVYRFVDSEHGKIPYVFVLTTIGICSEECA